jgi:hypothetical protein
VGAVVRRDVETRWGLLYKGLDMYYIPIQLRGYITIGWSTGPNRGCLPQRLGELPTGPKTFELLSRIKAPLEAQMGQIGSIDRS